MQSRIDTIHDNEIDTSEMLDNILESSVVSENYDIYQNSFYASVGTNTLESYDLKSYYPVIKHEKTVIISESRTFFGHIVEIVDFQFIARIYDGKSQKYKIGKFDIEEISTDDQKYVQLGAMFYIIVAREKLAGGQVKRTSTIRFKKAINPITQSSKTCDNLTSDAE